MVKMIAPLLVIGAVLLSLSYWATTTGFILELATLVAVTGLIYLVISKYGPKWTRTLEGKTLNMAIYLFIGATFLTGGFALVFGQVATPTGAIAALSGAAITGVPASVQITGIPSVTAVCDVSEELRGKASTVTLNGYDQAANSPFSAAVDALVYVEKNGEIVLVRDTTSGSLTSYSVGDRVSIKGGNASYYVTDKDFCIDTVQLPVELDVYSVASVGNMEISCFDNTASAACSSATNNTQEDFTISLGASQEETYYLKLEVATANVAFNLYGIAMVAFNDINKVTFLGATSGDDSAWSPAVMPINLTGVTFEQDDIEASDNLAGGFDSLYLRDNGPMLMLEWDSAKYKFGIEAGTTDPSATTTFASSDVGIVCFADAVWSRGVDGTMSLGIHNFGDNEINVGLNEDFYKPVTAGTAADICLTLAGE